MKADTFEVRGLFDTDVRYLIPIYQRNYRWNEKEQWQPLWEDLRNVAEDIAELGESGEVVDHFLGAIVCEQAPAFGLDAKAISVIDGQQRLTTLALFLAAMLSVCVDRGFEDHAAYLDSTVHNKDAVVRNRVEHRYKVWPNPADRNGFVAAMTAGTGVSRPENAVRFFRQRINSWLDVGHEDDPYDDLEYTPEQRIAALMTAVLRFVKIVKIDLETGDNAQLIFETLNGRGERLTDADLIRNALFRQADQEGLATETLYDTFWAPFDESRWLANVAHGRHQRDRLSLYCNHWLSMTVAKEVPASVLFPSFKDYLAKQKQPADVVAKDLARYGAIFDTFDSFEENSLEWWFFRRIAEMDHHGLPGTAVPLRRARVAFTD